MTDKYGLSPDLQVRETQIGTYHHPMDNPDEFEQFKIFQCQYNSIFKDFLNGVIDKQKLIERISNVDDREIPDGCDLFASLRMIELENKALKTVRLLTVD